MSLVGELLPEGVIPAMMNTTWHPALCQKLGALATGQKMGEPVIAIRKEYEVGEGSQ